MRISVHLCQRKFLNKHLRFFHSWSPCIRSSASSYEELCAAFLPCLDISGLTGHEPRTRNARFLSIQFTHGSKYMYECRHAFSGARLCWTVAECLGSTYGPYVVSLHTQRRGKQRWQGAWKSQYAKERILIWVRCICSWHARDLRISTQIALLRPESHGNCSQMKA